jgi:hypothetical protein
MDRTLFTPAMLETFRACKRAYQLAFQTQSSGEGKASPSAICKRFVLRGLAEINRGRITNPSQVQKFMGQNWPLDQLHDQPGGKDSATRAFLFAYKTLLRYVASPYRKPGSEVVAVATKVRARVPGQRLYLEDVFDLILWYPTEKRLELVIFHLKPLRHSDPSWPAPATLVRQHLADRLKVRWPFEKLTLTMVKVGPSEAKEQTINLEDSLYRLHWPEILTNLDEMKDLAPVEAHGDKPCVYCKTLEAKMVHELKSATDVSPVPLTA